VNGDKAKAVAIALSKLGSVPQHFLPAVISLPISDFVFRIWMNMARDSPRFVCQSNNI
jgi:hypothetical protein